ncbi:hypothetical protein [Demequina sp. NBRC 110056]|uniref:hypothetical protein n=1 Tax=Demequina sp. NBRC 110056 TaxID=1570345 RepID=UPI000A00837E|nr:hypothetical protein [Demequina sp. NBRC 110056]
MGDAHDTAEVCDHCGSAVSDDGWIGLEIARAGTPGAPFHDYLVGSFCSQAHAAAWLARPLPDPEPMAPYVPSLRDRLEDAGMVAALAVTLGFATVGLIVAARWVWTVV